MTHFAGKSDQTFVTMLAIFFACLLAPSSPALAEAGEHPCRMQNFATLAINNAQGFYRVDGEANGKSVALLFDSGASTTFLTRKTAEKLDLALSLSNTNVVGVSGESQLYIARLQSFSIGTFKGGRRNLPVIDISNLPNSVDGMIGADVMFQHDLELSMAEKKAKFFRPLDCEEVHLAYWDTNANWVPLEAMGDGNFLQHVMVEINGQKIRALLDTGADSSIITLSAARRAGIEPESAGVMPYKNMVGVGGKNSAKTWLAHFDSFKIGDEMIKDVRIQISDIWRAQNRENQSLNRDAVHQPDMLIGRDFFISHRILFAESQRRLYFTYVGGPVFHPGPLPAPKAQDG